MRYFGLIIGEKIPEHDESWEIYTLLRQIIDVLTSPRITVEDTRRLEKLIEQHHNLYRKNYGDLKPKFHHLVHYGRLLRMFGPCVHFWCMRYESQHRPIKTTAEAISSCKDLLYSVATKQVLKFRQSIHNLSTQNQSSISFGPSDDTKSNCYQNIHANGIFYAVGNCYFVDVCGIEKVFGQIKNIKFFEK